MFFHQQSDPRIVGEDHGAGLRIALFHIADQRCDLAFLRSVRKIPHPHRSRVLQRSNSARGDSKAANQDASQAGRNPRRALQRGQPLDNPWQQERSNNPEVPIFQMRTAVDVNRNHRSHISERYGQ